MNLPDLRKKENRPPAGMVLDLPMAPPEETACCGPPASPPSSPDERPGYKLLPFVESFTETPVGPVPRVKPVLAWPDLFGTLRARLGIDRNNYKVAPGLYCLGAADADSPVLVTANYKLSFDALRSSVGPLAAWLLVLDTRGINVWCAAGKGTLSTSELVNRVQAVGLERLVRHRRLVLPQLAAPGVSAFKVKKHSGFEVAWGPVRAHDLPGFLAAGSRCGEQERRVTFSLAERLVLVPVELMLVMKAFLVALLVSFVLSGIGPGIFSLSAMWQRGLAAASAFGLGIVAGAVLVPALLPWLPGRSFFLKGIFCALPLALLFFGLQAAAASFLEISALLLACCAVSSYTAMNFTGATPFTSPSGVEKEMRRGMPLQALALLAAACCWLAAPFFF